MHWAGLRTDTPEERELEVAGVLRLLQERFRVFGSSVLGFRV